MNGRLKSLDMLRGIAASAVVLRHAEAWPLGMIGVDIFFVISGYVMANIASGRTATRFIQDRFWRIYPIYWIALVPWLLIAVHSGALTSVRAASNLMLVPLWFSEARPLLFLAWTLVFEILFYCAVATAIKVRSVKPPLILFLLCLAAWPLTGSTLFMWFGNPIILEFLFGVAIACLPLKSLPGAILLAVGLLWLILFPTLSYAMEVREFSPSLLRVLMWGIPSALIVYGLLGQEQRLRGAIVDGLCAIGAASYSIYLFHMLVTDIFVAHWLLEFIAAMGLGFCAWFLLEQPIMRWAARRSEAMNDRASRHAGPPLVEKI